MTTITIDKIRLGKGEVETPGMKIVSKSQKDSYLEGANDLAISILSEENGEALIKNKWLPLGITKNEKDIMVNL